MTKCHVHAAHTFLLYVGRWARTIPTFVRYIQHISTLVELPNMILPLNPADEPLAALKEGEKPRPLLAFCKIPGFSDILIPNTAEGTRMF